MDRVLQLNEFFVEGGNPELSHVLLHITEPSTLEEKKKGYFFALCEINDAEGRHIVKLQNLIDEIENGYYETPDQENKTSLEVVLEKINQQNPNLFIKPGPSLSYVVGAIRQPEIIFSYHGRPQIIIFYKNHEGTYQRMSLTEDAPAEERQLFSQIIQGKISPSDYFFVGTPRFADYFNNDRLEKIITSRPPRQSAEHLQRVLSELKNGLSFGGLVIHLGETGATNLAHRPKARPGNGSDKSLKSLFNTQENTANTLSPSLLRRFNQKVQTLIKNKLPSPSTSSPARSPATEYVSAEIKAAHLRQHQVRQNGPTKTNPGEQLTNLLNLTGQTLKYLGRVLAWLGVAVFTLFKGLATGLILVFFVTTNYQKRRQHILDDWRRALYSYRENFKQLSPLARILLVAAVALAFVFMISLIYLGARQRSAAREKSYQENMQLVKTKRDLAESSIIYNDEAAALGAAQEAKARLATLDCSSRAHRDECKTISGQLENVLVKVRKVVGVKPEFLADWSNLEKGQMQLLKINSKFIAYGASSTLFTYDLLTKENKILPTGFGNFMAGTAPKENDFALFLRGNNELLKFDPKNNSLTRADLTFPEQKSEIKAMVVYNRRLYTLDTLNNKIYKHDNIKTGFGQGKDWLRESGADLTNGVSITIDGDLFALKNNGEIYKFTGGVKQPFALQGLDPLLTSGGKIFTYTDLLRLYILDSAGKRLLVLNKDGKLLKQITASQFVSPTGLVVDEPQNKAYILDNGKLYQIGL